MAIDNTEKSVFVLIVQNNPPGSENLAPPDLYAGAYTWSLYIANEFACSGKRFATQAEAFAAATEFLQSFPNQQDITINNPDQN